MARMNSAVSICVKYTLFFWNFILWCIALLLTGLGAYILVLKGKVVKDPIDFFFDPASLMCTAGSIAVVITLLGWLGALREYTCCLNAYKWILTLLFFGEIVLIVFVFVFYFVPDAKQKLGFFPEKTFKDAISKYGVVDDDDMKNFIDNMQESLQCCGFSDDDNGFLAWNENQYYNCPSKNKTNNVPNPEACSVPPSCCKLREGQIKNILCGRNAMTRDTTENLVEDSSNQQIYKQGCMKAVGSYINDNAMVIGGAMLGILLPQLYFMYLSRTLRQQILLQKSKWT